MNTLVNTEYYCVLRVNMINGYYLGIGWINNSMDSFAWWNSGNLLQDYRLACLFAEENNISLIIPLQTIDLVGKALGDQSGLHSEVEKGSSD